MPLFPLARAILKAAERPPGRRRASSSGPGSQLSRQPRPGPSHVSSMSPSAGLRQMKCAYGSLCCWTRYDLRCLRDLRAAFSGRLSLFGAWRLFLPRPAEFFGSLDKARIPSLTVEAGPTHALAYEAAPDASVAGHALIGDMDADCVAIVLRIESAARQGQRGRKGHRREDDGRQEIAGRRQDGQGEGRSPPSPRRRQGRC